jgi:hypothetical protein
MASTALGTTSNSSAVNGTRFSSAGWVRSKRASAYCMIHPLKKPGYVSGASALLSPIGRDAQCRFVDQRRTIPGSHPLTRLAVAYCAHPFGLSGQIVMLGSLPTQPREAF